MPEIKPFRAWRYNLKKIGDPSLVVAPPYDVISRDEQEKLYQRSPYNVIRLELGKDNPGDTEKANVYTRARDCLRDWKSSQAMIREAFPCLYISVQNYSEEGKPKTRIGFYGAMKLDEHAVRKHENTLNGPKEDRLKLIKEVGTNLSPIFGLFEDTKGTVQAALRKSLKKKPLLDISIAGVRHRLYEENRPDLIQTVTRAMKSKPMFIADGHHRFEVALQYKKWMKARTLRASRAGDAEWEYVLTYFSDCLHNPFKIFPTHRLIRLPKGKSLLQELKKAGSLRKVAGLKEVLTHLEKTRQETKVKHYTFGLYSSEDGFYLLTLDKKTVSGIKKNPVETLDVAVLHQQILEPFFGIRLESAHGGARSKDLEFTRDANEAVEKVRNGLFHAAVFLRPASLGEMLLVSKKGLKMPQKSTYFYPKLLTGLVFHGLETEHS